MKLITFFILLITNFMLNRDAMANELNKAHQKRKRFASNALQVMKKEYVIGKLNALYAQRGLPKLISEL